MFRLAEMKRFRSIFIIASFLAALAAAGFAQPAGKKDGVRPVTVPISIFSKKELKEGQTEEYLQADRIIVREDGDEQQILSIRSVSTTPLSIAFVIQEDLTAGFNLQIKDIQEFIRGLPKGTRVMVAYTRSGSPQIRQRFTEDLDAAANSLRVVAGSSALAPRSAFAGLDDILDRFDGLPTGRRAVVLFSDGLDSSGGMNLASIAQSFDLDRATLRANRKGVAVYSVYNPTARTENSSGVLALASQGALAKLSDETGGRAFFSGTGAAVSFQPFFREMIVALSRQFALTYLSTHMKKGYHKIKITSTNPEVKIEHPRGYYYR
jgi:VWFA-related protein